MPRKTAANNGQKVGDKFTKLSKIGFSMDCFTTDFFATFCQKTFGNSFGNSYIHFLVIMIQFHFSCGEEKLCYKVKKSTNVLPKIADDLLDLCAVSNEKKILFLHISFKLLLTLLRFLFNLGLSALIRRDTNIKFFRFQYWS